jgi:SAM-dependent methyltransferase
MTVSSTFLAADGDGYELQMGRWSRRLAPHFISFAGVDSGHVLDVGCGTGSLAFELARQARIASVKGVDFSEAYVGHARSHNRDARIGFEVGDACAMPFPDGSFDAALSQLVLQFVPEPERAIREMRRVTKPGGTVAAAVWDARGGFVAFRIFWDTAAMLDPAADARRAKSCARVITHPGGLANAWRAAGLTNVAQDMITIRMDFASFADFWKPVEGRDGPFAEYASTLAPEAKVRLREALQKAYLDGAADGERSYAATAWVVKGTVPG